MGLKHLGIKDGDSGRDHVAHPPRLADGGHRRPVARRRHLPDLPPSEPGQAAFVINNVKARLLFVENLQQYNKIEKVRADCPTLEHVVVIDDRRQAAAHGGQLRRHLRPGGGRARRDPPLGEHWRTFRPRQGGDHRPHLGNDREPEGRGADPRQHPAQLRGGHPGGRLQRERPVPLVPAAVAHDGARGGQFVPLDVAAPSPTRSRHRAPAGQHGRDRSRPSWSPCRACTSGSTPGSSRRSRPGAGLDSGSSTGRAALAREHYQNHLDGKQDSPWLGLQMRVADRLVFGKIRARTGGRVRYFVSGARRCRGRSASSSTRWACSILEGYGLTETAPVLTHQPAR